MHAQPRNTNRVIGFILLLFTAIPAFAGLSAELEDWGSGPAQWIMTSDEKKAWRKISTDADAINFMDLFWARRDPTPGTAVNEFRDRFVNRVAFSDMTFIEKRTRGAMTDRGRVYIVLGAATNMAGVTAQVDSQPSVASVDPGVVREPVAEVLWFPGRANATSGFGSKLTPASSRWERSRWFLSRTPSQSPGGATPNAPISDWPALSPSVRRSSVPI